MIQPKPGVREFWKSTVPANTFGIVVLVVAIPVCILGFYTIETGRVPEMGSGLVVSLLAIHAMTLIIRVYKFRGKAFTLDYILNSLGAVLFLSSFLVKQDTPIESYLSTSGCLLITFTIFSTYFQFRKRNAIPIPPRDPGE